MSKMKRLEEGILEILEDEKCHSIGEIKSVFIKKDPEVLESPTLIYVVLNRMTKKDIVKNIKRGMYKMYTEEMKKAEMNEKEMDVDEMIREESITNKVLIEWNKVYDMLSKEYVLSYEMTEEEYRKGKLLYQLNKRIENVIKSFPIEDEN